MTGDNAEQSMKKIESELKPFIDCIRTKGACYEFFKQAYVDFQERFARALNIAKLFAEADKEMPKLPRRSPKRTLYMLFAYLGFVETLGNSLLDIVVMLLVANGRDLHIECQYTTPRIKHAVSIKDLEKEKVPLTTKLNFLRENGITEFASVIDSELRNSIAHLRFEVKQNDIYLKGKPAYQVVRDGLATLGYYAIRTFLLFVELDGEIGLARKWGVKS